MKRTALILVMGFALVAAAPADEFDGVEVVDDAELWELRGGFNFKDLAITLGTDIRTFVNGELALHTVVNWTQQGATSETTYLSSVLTPATAAELQNGILSSGGITMRVGDQEVYLANGGQTALFHNTDGTIQNVIVNTASKTAITQEVDATVGVGGYDAFRAELNRDQLRSNLNQASTISMPRGVRTPWRARGA